MDYRIKVKDYSIDGKIKGLNKAIEHERKLYQKHLSFYSALMDEYHVLLNQRKALFPEQYTKYGSLRKAFKDNPF